MSDSNLILKDTGSEEQTNRLVCMYAETVFHDEQTLRGKRTSMSVRAYSFFVREGMCVSDYVCV